MALQAYLVEAPSGKIIGILLPLPSYRRAPSRRIVLYMYILVLMLSISKSYRTLHPLYGSSYALTHWRTIRKRGARLRLLMGFRQFILPDGAALVCSFKLHGFQVNTRHFKVR